MLIKGRRGTVQSIPYRATRLLRTSATARIAGQTTGELFDWADRLLAFLENDALLGRLLARAVAESIVARVREDFLSRMYQAFDMETEHGLKPHRRNEAALAALREAHLRMATAELADDADARQAALDAVGAAAKRLRETTGEDRSSHRLSSGLFRPLTLQVLSALTDVGLMGTHRTATGVMVGVGQRDRVERIKTPSATEFALGIGPTRSKYKILWRHLEYGTGVYRGWLPVPKAPSRYNEFRQANTGNVGARPVDASTEGPSVYEAGGVQPPGTWYWGRNEREARMVLRGTHGMHLLHNKLGHVIDDHAKLAQTFGDLLRRTLLTTT